MTERARITLPLSLAERETLRAARAEYGKALDAAWAEYGKARDAARAEYGKALDAARAEYGKALDAAWAEYGKARDAAWAEYGKARDAARAEYGKARGSLPLVAWIVTEFYDGREDEASSVIEALVDGATLAGIKAVASRKGWCEEWDYALVEALTRFDIVDTK